MSKGLEALEEIKKQVGNIHYFDFSGDIPKQTSYELREMPLFCTIEKELKRLEDLERAFHSLSKEDERTKKLLSKEIEKNRALEIIKAKSVNARNLIIYCLEMKRTYQDYIELFNYCDNYCELGRDLLTQEEYDLLKEVLL